jgi:gluconokinase
MTIVLMGVCGSGKTTVGLQLAERLGWAFHDADDFHPKDNKRKMNQGMPLTDEDRVPWLLALQTLLRDNRQAGRSILLACSALKERYREVLADGDPDVRFVLLDGSRELIAGRLDARKGHYMNPGLLDSQFAALEVPQNALSVSIAGTPEEIADEIQDRLALR